MFDLSNIPNSRRVPTTPSPSSSNASGTTTPRGKDASLVHREALDLFAPGRPKAKRLVHYDVPTGPGPVLPTPGVLGKPLPRVDADIQAAFDDAGLPVTPGSPAEEAAQFVTRLMREMACGEQRAEPIPFYEPIVQAFAITHEGAMNAACKENATAIGLAVAEDLLEQGDADTAQLAGTRARPFVIWDAADNGWSINLHSGAFVNALWELSGGRSAKNLEKFEGLMRRSQEAARGPIADTLGASEERLYDLIDRVAEILLLAQAKRSDP